MLGVIITAGKPPPAFDATGILSVGLPPAINQSLSHVPFRIILALFATPASILSFW